MSQKAREILEKFRESDKRLVESFNVLWGWRHCPIEERIEFLSERLLRTTSALVLIAEALTETASETVSEGEK